MKAKKIRGRFAPSPTGEMHLGNAWTALLAWLQVRQAGGSMVLRIEDLDPERSREEYIAGLMADLSWLGLDWDEGPDCGGPYGPYRQEERRERYSQALYALDEQKLLYPCYCTRAEIRQAASAPNGPETGLEYAGTCKGLTSGERKLRESQGRTAALRLRVPGEEIGFCDLCQGRVKQNLNEVGDFVVRRADGVHAYQLAVVVDDALMGITHVLRGSDLLPSAARQIWLFRQLGYTEPCFSHVPLLNGPDGYRLSKRHGSVSIAALRAGGLKAEEIIGYLAFLAGMTGNLEPVTARELIPYFNLGKLPKQPIEVNPVNFATKDSV